MCDCLKRETEIVYKQNAPFLDKGRYFVLLVGQLSMHADKGNSKEPNPPFGGSSTFLINYCPWCGEKLEVKLDQDGTSNRVFYEKT